MGNQLDLGMTFATLSYFDTIQKPLIVLPRLFATIANLFTAGRMSSQLALSTADQPERLTELFIVSD